MPEEIDTNSESYQEGYQTGQTWKHDYRPGGPWHYGSHSWDTETTKRLARTSQQRHREWMAGFDQAIADRGGRIERGMVLDLPPASILTDLTNHRPCQPLPDRSAGRQRQP